MSPQKAALRYRVCWHATWTALSTWLVIIHHASLRCSCVRFSSIAQFSPLLPRLLSLDRVSVQVWLFVLPYQLTIFAQGTLFSPLLANRGSAPPFFSGQVPNFYSPGRLSTCMCWFSSLALSQRQYQTLSPTFDSIFVTFNIGFSLASLLRKLGSLYCLAFFLLT